MIRSQRKKHLIIWVIIALVLPALFFAAYLSKPEPQIYNLPSDQDAVLPELLATSQKQNVIFSVYTNQDQSKYQLEIRLLKPLDASSAFILLDKQKVIGVMGDNELSIFNLSLKNADHFTISIFDKFKGETIVETNFDL